VNIVFVHSILPEDDYRVHVRCRNFASALQASGRHAVNLLILEDFISNNPAAVKTCQPADIIILHRYLFESTLAAIARWRARGKKVLVDIDLSVEHLEPEQAGFSFWQKGVLPPSLKNGSRPIYPSPAEQLKWLLKMVDGILVPTSQLAYDYFPYGRVQLLVDYLNINEFLVVPSERRENVLWLGLNLENKVFGSLKQSGALEGIERALQQNPALRLLVIAPHPSFEPWLSKFSPARLEVHRQISPHELPAILSKADVGLLPAYGEFDLRQSPLPAVEYMAMKIPWIASSQPVYQSLAEYGGLVNNSAAEWAAAILETAENIETARQRAAGRAYLYALSQDAAENVEKIERAIGGSEEAA